MLQRYKIKNVNGGLKNMKEFNFFKRALKNKIRITRSLFVFFLITGGVSYGQVNEGAEKSTVTVTEQDFENKGTINVKEGNAVKIEAPSNITNSGLISGFASLHAGSATTTTTAYAYATANGIVSCNDSSNSSSIGDITNSGLISGYIYSLSGEANNKKDYVSLEFSGNGISVNDNISNKINNDGVIKGSTSAIAAKSITNITNNGILAGREIFSNGEELHAFSSTKSEKPLGQISPVTETNNGIYIKLESEISSDNSNNETGNVKVDTKGNPEIKEIKNGTGGVVTLEDGSNKTVINGELYDQNGSSTTISTSARDSYVISNGSYKDSIINGAGMKEGSFSCR